MPSGLLQQDLFEIVGSDILESSILALSLSFDPTIIWRPLTKYYPGRKFNDESCNLCCLLGTILMNILELIVGDIWVVESAEMPSWSAGEKRGVELFFHGQ